VAKVGIQLYTVRDLLAEDYEGTIVRMKELGYEGVEFPGGLMEKMNASDLKKLLGSAGLELAGITFTHDDYTRRMDKILRYSRECGCTTVVYPWIPEELRKTADDYREIIRMMNNWGSVFKKKGIRFLYHLHGYELDKNREDDGFSLMVKYFDWDVVQFEIDLYWVEYAGFDAMEIMEKYGQYSPSVHFKDYRDDGNWTDTEVGEGVIDMEKAARLGLQRGASWFIVEQEKFNMPSIESAAVSAKNLLRIRSTAEKSLGGNWRV
jgi:sugar phosphate isomerase/epimerase